MSHFDSVLAFLVYLHIYVLGIAVGMLLAADQHRNAEGRFVR